MEKSASCAVVVCSCDKYSDLWDPYFELFKKFWADCPYPVFLNTETKTYKTDGLDIRVVNAEKGKDDWSSRLIHAIKQTDAEFILLTLDDHFLLQPVDGARFGELVEYMKKHPKIAQMSFLTDIYEKGRLLNGVWIKQKTSDVIRVTASTALWRRDRLLALLREGEDAWQFEGGASRRSMYDRHEYYSYEGKPDWPAPIIDCAQHVYRGYGVFRGKWLWNNEEFFKENGISVDFSVRGVLTEDEFTKLREENIKKASEDWREDQTFLADLYRHTPTFILKAASRIKRIFIKRS